MAEDYNLSHLKQLEAESIYIIREVAAEYLPIDLPWLALVYKTFLLALYALYVYQREFSRRTKAA